MMCDRANNIIWTDAVFLAFVQLQADHAFFMRNAARLSELALDRSAAWCAPEIFLKLARRLGFDIRDLRDGTLFLIGARDLQRRGGDVQRIMSSLD